MQKNKLIPLRTISLVILVALLTFVSFFTPRLIHASPHAVVDDANTVALLHMDGADGSTQFIDESGKVWVAIGDPRISNSPSKFNQSLELDSNDALLGLDTDEVYFALSDFTIDFWVRFETRPDSNVVIFSQQPDINNGMTIQWGASGRWVFQVNTGGMELVNLAGISSSTPGTWTHVAIVRDSNVFRLFENGVQIGTVAGTDAIPNFAAPIYIGTTANSESRNLDEFRISRSARWTTNFTAPAAPYEAPTPTPTHTATITPTLTNTPTTTLTSTGTLPTSTPTSTQLTSTPTSNTITATPNPGSVSIVTVSAVITINENNTNTNDTGSGSSGTSSSGGSFSAVTPVPFSGQGGVAAFGGLSCGGYYIRARVYVDDNQDKMMSPAEGITGLQVFFMDQTYARLGSTYSLDGKAEFCIPVTQYGKSVLIDIPYLQLFGTLQIPDQPNQDLEIWFPGEPPVLPLFLP